MLKNILIIDDDERLRELLDEYLTEKNYKIYHSDDFNSGKEILEYFIFDLIIVDRMMPSGDGINLINIIKEKYILVSIGEDKRTKKLCLTQKGLDLEAKLSKIQIDKIKSIINDAKESDINGFKKILYSMIDEKSKKIFNTLNE